MYFAKPVQYVAANPSTNTGTHPHSPALTVYSPALFLMSGTWQNLAESIPLPKVT